MVNSARFRNLPLEDPTQAPSRAETELRLARFTPLEAMGVGASALVTGFEALEVELTDWLRAVGIAEGEQVTILRRAAFGGPIHVRTGSGGEFALHRSLARSILVREPST